MADDRHEQLCQLAWSPRAVTIFIQSARDARERVPLLCEVPNTAHVAFVVQRTVAFGAPQGWRRYCWRGRVRSSSLRLPRARCRADGWAVEFRILVQQMLHFAQQRIGRDGLHEYRIRARHSRHSSRVSASATAISTRQARWVGSGHFWPGSWKRSLSATTSESTVR